MYLPGKTRRETRDRVGFPSGSRTGFGSPKLNSETWRRPSRRKEEVMNTSRTREKIEDSLEAITDQIAEGIRKGKYSLQEFQSTLVDKTKSAARTADDYVHENSWKSIAVVALVGVVIGLAVGRRD